MRLAVTVVVALALLASTAMAVPEAREAVTRIREFEKTRPDTVPWEDDIESGENGWTHGDLTATAVPHFHPDTYMAYQGGTSWWCGNFDYDEDGGYGNNWDDRLEVPPTDWTGHTYPVIEFWERHDSEPDYDFTWIQCESTGVWVNLNRGYNGSTANWVRRAYYLGSRDNPAVCRFRFLSDGGWSDEDYNGTTQPYQSIGGAFMCDNIKIYDYITQDVIFFDDVESGGLCTPAVAGAAGDYWRIEESACQAFSDPHVWVVAYPDTDFVQPNVQNWLQTPVIDISAYVPVSACTLWTVFQFMVPAELGDGWLEEVSTDGGETWTTVGNWWGDQCEYGYGPCDHFLFWIPVRETVAVDASDVAVRWVMQTDDAGASPNVLCADNSVGITIDDTWLQVYYTATPDAAFAAAQEALMLDGYVGGEVVGTFQVENTGNVDLESGQVTFEMSDLDGPPGNMIPDTSAEFDPTTVAMPFGGDPATIGLTIDVPTGIDAGDYEGSLGVYVGRVLADELDITVTLELLSEEPLAYPNPYRADTHESEGVTIALGGAGEGAKVKIYDMFTALVRDLTDDIGEGDTEVFWDLENDEGDMVASGMYLVTIDDDGDVETLRIMVIK